MEGQSEETPCPRIYSNLSLSSFQNSIMLGAKKKEKKKPQPWFLSLEERKINKHYTTPPQSILVGEGEG